MRHRLVALVLLISLSLCEPAFSNHTVLTVEDAKACLIDLQKTFRKERHDWNICRDQSPSKIISEAITFGVFFVILSPVAVPMVVSVGLFSLTDAIVKNRNLDSQIADIQASIERLALLKPDARLSDEEVLMIGRFLLDEYHKTRALKKFRRSPLLKSRVRRALKKLDPSQVLTLALIDLERFKKLTGKKKIFSPEAQPFAEKLVGKIELNPDANLENLIKEISVEKIDSVVSDELKTPRSPRQIPIDENNAEFLLTLAESKGNDALLNQLDDYYYKLWKDKPLALGQIEFANMHHLPKTKTLIPTSMLPMELIVVGM